jgi:hypothetical protein
MRSPIWMGVAAISTVGFINSAFACQFDTDCGVGSRCLKAAGQIYGICAGGMNPGNNSDRSPVYSPLDPNRTVGNTCDFNTVESRLLKSKSRFALMRRDFSFEAIPGNKPYIASARP